MCSLIFLAIGADVAGNLFFMLLSVLYIILCLYFSLCTRQRLIHRYAGCGSSPQVSQCALHCCAKAKSGMCIY